MAPLDILSHVRRTPFEPFRLILIDKASYDIRHPDQCMVLKREVVIGTTGLADEVIEWTIKFNCLNVLKIEPLPTPTCGTTA